MPGKCRAIASAVPACPLRASHEPAGLVEPADRQPRRAFRRIVEQEVRPAQRAVAHQRGEFGITGDRGQLLAGAAEIAVAEERADFGRRGSWS